MLPDNAAERLRFPSYLKDTEGMDEHPGKMVGDKLYPLVEDSYPALLKPDLQPRGNPRSGRPAAGAGAVTRSRCWMRTCLFGAGLYGAKRR
jgi:hypothetical protein